MSMTTTRHQRAASLVTAALHEAACNALNFEQSFVATCKNLETQHYCVLWVTTIDKQKYLRVSQGEWVCTCLVWCWLRQQAFSLSTAHITTTYLNQTQPDSVNKPSLWALHTSQQHISVKLNLTQSTSLLSEHCTHHNNISQSNSTCNK